MCNYYPNKLIYFEFFRPLRTKKIKNFFQTLKKNYEVYLWYREAFKKKKDINDKKILTIYGSDEIWNFKNAYHGYNPFYFGSGNDTLKISYAASIGRASFFDLNDKIKDEIKNNLGKFNSISVRDNNSYDFVKKLTNIEADIVLDPTLIHTPKILSEERFNKIKIVEKYIVVYGTVFDQVQRKLIHDFAKKNQLIVISVGYYNNWIENNCLGLNPTNFINLLKNSSFVFTSMFHGVMFSIKFSKQFYLSIDPIRKNKLETILNTLDLKNRIFSDKINFELINYEDVNFKLNKMITKSQDILKRYIANLI